MIKISLVLTSYDRQSDLDRFAAGLIEQTFPGEIELIYVAQGNATLVLPPTDCRITLKEYRSGGLIPLSKARNIGLAHASGDIIGFPDDDCWYGPDVLTEIAGYFDDHSGVSCICTNVYDPIRKRTYARRPIDLVCNVTFRNLYQLPISTGIFIRRETLVKAGAYFDEKYGVGTELGSGEETEFVSRILSSSQLVRYVGTIQVFHPAPDYSPSDAKKSYRYGIGLGYMSGVFLQKGHFAILFRFVEIIARSSAGIVVHCFSPANRAVYLCRLRGIFVGLVRSLASK